MGDKEFIREIAERWVELGGDAEGLDYVYNDLKQAINEEMVKTL